MMILIAACRIPSDHVMCLHFLTHLVTLYLGDEYGSVCMCLLVNMCLHVFPDMCFRVELGYV